MDTTSGSTRSKNGLTFVSSALQPNRRLAQMAIASIRTHAVTGMRFHKPPGHIPGVQHIVHARDHQGDDRIRLRDTRRLDHGPELGLQLIGSGIDLLQLLPVGGGIKQDPLIEIIYQQPAPFATSAAGSRPTRRYSVPMALASSSS